MNSESKAAKHYGGLWLPFLDAFDAGLYLFWITEKCVVCCARPSLSIVNERLHNEFGPAVWWPNGTSFYFWKGLRVDKEIILHPQNINLAQIESESNVELRRVLIERFGQERFLLEAKADKLHEDDFGILYRKKIPDDEDLYMVKVVNSTPEPDGSFRDYFIRVDPKAYGGLKTARAAVASTWRQKDGTFAFTSPEEYAPCFES